MKRILFIPLLLFTISCGSDSGSPDGSEIAFVSTRTRNMDIYLVNADGSGSTVNLTLNSANDNTPHWSPVEE